MEEKVFLLYYYYERENIVGRGFRHND